jgi:hypothetical protein
VGLVPGKSRNQENDKGQPTLNGRPFFPVFLLLGPPLVDQVGFLRLGVVLLEHGEVHLAQATCVELPESSSVVKGGAWGKPVISVKRQLDALGQRPATLTAAPGHWANLSFGWRIQ